MTLKLLTIAAATLAVAATAANAGGFRYGSAGGNFGNWAYSDAASGGTAKVSGWQSGSTSNESYAETHNYRGYKTAGSSASTGNMSQFQTKFGMGSATSGSSAVAGSGLGKGLGFKLGKAKVH